MEERETESRAGDKESAKTKNFCFGRKKLLFDSLMGRKGERGKNSLKGGERNLD